MTARLADASARERVCTETGSTLFVNAGAGSGKTSALVDRVLQLVLHDHVPLRHVAAVTFTDKAGAELRDRLRVAFERAVLKADGTEEAARDALDDLDQAAIGTLHAFAQRLLSEHPIEARLPPQIEVLDEIGSAVAFEDRWSGIRGELLDDETMAEPLLLGMAVGITLDQLRSLSLLLGNDWDLLQERILGSPVERVVAPDLTDFRRKAELVLDQRERCRNDNDRLLPKLDDLAAQLAQVEAAPDPETALMVLRETSELKSNRVGTKGNWTVPIDQVRDGVAEVAADAKLILDRLRTACLRRLTEWLAVRVLAAAESRRGESRLEFHDLLVLARDLLRSSPAARHGLHQRYQRLLLDEFQDTDPIQIELAVRITAGEAADAEDWHDIPVPPGRLFVVGDPKQSIYRFRRASIATYLDAAQHLGEEVSLTTNFRSVAPVLDWVNTVFGTLIQPVVGGQPAYAPLDQHRSQRERGPGVTVLGRDMHLDLPSRGGADELRVREAADVAAVVQHALADGWQVTDSVTKELRAARPDDIAVLVPARTSLPFLEDALTAAGVEYRAESSSLVYQADEVRSLLACARAVADSTDQLALVQVLRSSLFGCGDDDLWRWKHAGGALNLYAELEDEALSAGPVGTALRYLKRLSFDARAMLPSELLATVVADRRMWEVAADRPRSRDAWRRLRFIVDQARAWSEVAAGGGLREYVAWASHQGQETRRVAEAVLPEKDADAVRIMTIHAAKGLEFPIVVLSGMTAQQNRRRGVQLLWPPEGGYAVKLSKDVQAGDFDAAAPVDEQMDQLEKRRLLYVAATRARDHLVVSLHRKQKGPETAAALLAAAGAGTAAEAVPFAAPSVALPMPGPAVATVSPPPEFDDWWRGVMLARRSSERPSALSASGLEGTEPEIVLAASPPPAGLAKGARDLELPPWTKGRYGSAVGRAVHAVLQVVALDSSDSDDGVDRAVAAQCVAEGLLGQESLVRDLVGSALSSPLVQRAAAREHWREQYVGTMQDDGTVLEGYIDLIFRDDDATLVVVDYKTDAIPAGALASRVIYYQPQMEAYVQCLSAATGAAVRAELLFLHPTVSATAVPV